MANMSAEQVFSARKSLLSFFEFLQDTFFYPPDSRLAKRLNAAWMLGLYLVGVYLWGIFFSWGNISFDFLDWAEVTGPRYALLQDAARQNELPLHANNDTILRNVTDRYLAIADTPFSPQFYLLRFISMGQFAFVDTLLLYTLGFLGLVWMGLRYRFSPWVFGLACVLFNFNGSLDIHLAVGHENWVAQFLLPYFVLLVFHLVERRRAGWLWVLGMVITLLTILLQGHFHLFVWCLIFLGLLGIAQWHLIKPIFWSGLFTGLICLPRLLPPALVLKDITQNYLGGFSSLLDLVASLVILRDPIVSVSLPSDMYPLSSWEVDFYIGLMGILLLFYFGIYRPLRLRKSTDGPYLSMFLPITGITVLSIGSIYEVILHFLPVPPLTGERVTSRMFILPFVFILTYALMNLQGWLSDMRSVENGRKPSWGLLGGLLAATLVLLHDLYRHLVGWRIRNLDGLVQWFPKVPFDPTRVQVANHADPIYTNLLLGGLGVAVLALVVLVWLIWRERRNHSLSAM